MTALIPLITLYYDTQPNLQIIQNLPYIDFTGTEAEATVVCSTISSKVEGISSSSYPTFRRNSSSFKILIYRSQYDKVNIKNSHEDHELRYIKD